MARHQLDAVSLIAGLAFALVGAVSLVGDLSFGAQANLMWPVLLAALGLSLLLSSRSGGGSEHEQPAADGAEELGPIGAGDGDER